MGLGIKLVTCVIIFLRTRAEKTFLKESILGHPERTDAVADECIQTPTRHRHSRDVLEGEALALKDRSYTEHLCHIVTETLPSVTHL